MYQIFRFFVFMGPDFGFCYSYSSDLGPDTAKIRCSQPVLFSWMFMKCNARENSTAFARIQVRAFLLHLKRSQIDFRFRF